MQETTTVKFNGKDVKILELTIKQVRDIFSSLDKEDPQFIDDIMNLPVPVKIAEACTGITAEEMEETKPSELEKLLKGVEQTNPFLVGLIRRRVEAFDQMQNVLRKQSMEISAD